MSSSPISTTGCHQHRFRQPDVIITDFDNQMKAVLDDQFPEVQQQLCIHHINSNVLLKAKKKWLKGRNSVSPDSSDDAEASISQTQAELSPKDRQFIHAPAAEAIPPGGALSSVVSSSGVA
ncbi:uncharacterized protein VDAG_04792 [Verticillium dahliae VdLs.17]|uniref:MULE transposase domain-containing protein n=2 Tax=Verticillium dahliae TaxID=27337 RepID=G2X455_VERDV|nr:uncharacterized protein VDAG_04792 [Verticillium dahliae VdLs.17]AER39701.1 transposase [Verticillium dahliae]EGY23354.1 hypothetical protein VDAG_04792 [Verticillium dahliae VdLs.17]